MLVVIKSRSFFGGEEWGRRRSLCFFSIQIVVETEKNCKTAKSPLMMHIYVHVWRAKKKGIMGAPNFCFLGKVGVKMNLKIECGIKKITFSSGNEVTGLV